MTADQLSIASDFLGLLSGFLLVIPAAKDQARRRKMDSMERVGNSDFSVSKAAKEVWNVQRSEARRFSQVDTLMILAGALFLMLSFLVSIVGQLT